MAVTIPLGLQERLTIGHVSGCGGGWWAMRWRKRQFPHWNDDGSSFGGVREPLPPRLPALDGEVALSSDADG
jgi:hypothetical protein